MRAMTEHDAAFMWETEALRESFRRSEISDRPASTPEPARHWTTLRDAHYLTGIPIETLRKWARKSAVPSFLDESDRGVRRMVRVDAVRARAAQLGRPIAPIPRAERGTANPGVVVDSDPAPVDEPATSTPGPTTASVKPPDVEAPSALETPGTRDGLPPQTMIVPIAAWDKMLMQLGNLHEAGQQLADSRERAAKAETEAAFLRERLGEMRHELSLAKPENPSDPGAATEPPERPPPTEETAAAPPVASSPAPTEMPAPEKLWKYVYRGWRARRRH